MSMEKLGFFKRAKKAIGIGVLSGATLLSPQGQGNAEASQKAITTAEAAVDLAKFDVEHATPEERLAKERALQEARGRLKVAKAEDRDEKEEKSTSTSKIGVAPKNTAEITVTSREVAILDENGEKIGTAMEGSKEWAKLEKLRIEKNAEIEKKRAEANKPTIIVDNPYTYSGGRYYVGSERYVSPPRYRSGAPQSSPTPRQQQAQPDQARPGNTRGADRGESDATVRPYNPPK